VTVPDIPASAVIVAASDLLATEFGDELVILNLRDGVYYGLEDVGARIWRLLQQPVSMIAIRDAVVADYDVEPARCEQDIRTLLAELLAKGLVEIREGA